MTKSMLDMLHLSEVLESGQEIDVGVHSLGITLSNNICPYLVFLFAGVHWYN